VIDRRRLLSLSAVALAASLAPIVRADVPKSAPFDAATFDAALAAGKPMLVEISASWCPTCRAQKAVFAELLQEPRFADLLILEVDFDTRKDVVRALGARRQSTLILYAGGQEVARSVGETWPDRLEALLDQAF
jgi:thiol-disulfide isomerase/thioredoxin